MQFVALDSNEQLISVTLEQAEKNVYVRVDGLVIIAFEGHEVTVNRQSAVEKGLNLIVEE